MKPFYIDPPGMRGAAPLLIEHIEYHRNGISGTGFHTVKFLYINGDSVVDLVGVVFGVDSSNTTDDVAVHRAYTAVINPLDLTQGWRGDAFDAVLREAVLVSEPERDAERDGLLHAAMGPAR